MSKADLSKRLDRVNEIRLSVKGRKSGKDIPRPVWFVHEGNKIYLLPVNGSDTEWYKNALKNPTITLSANDDSFTAEVKPITDPARVKEVVAKFRAKYGDDDVEKYYSKFDVAAEVTLH